MSDPVIQVKNLSKVYKISHEQRASAGNSTLRDTLVGAARKPFELISGQKMEKEKFWALKDINFEVNQGDTLGIVGRNGSGKSTLLKVLSRIVEPTEGEIRMKGRVASLLEVGTGFHPELTGRENIFFNGAILGMKQSEIRAKFKDIVEFSEIENFLDTPVKFYSSGMYVKLAFAVAAHLEPDILIVDEVLAVGDAAFQKKCLGKMNSVAKEGRTVLFVSHNANALRDLCQTAILLDHGTVSFAGSISDALEAYSSSYTDYSADYVAKPNPDQDVQILSMKVSSSDGNTSGVYDYNKPMKAEISYEVRKSIAGSVLGVELYSLDGVPLVSSYDMKSMDNKPGKYTTEVNIPAGFLTHKQYYIVASIEEPGSRYYDRTDELSFECYKGDTLEDKHKAAGNFGYIADNFTWNQKSSHN